jgi:tRNA1(Val) A37 N6-methylase TrmN6
VQVTVDGFLGGQLRLAQPKTGYRAGIDLLAALEGCLGSIVVQPLAPRAGRPAHLILLRARKSGRAAFQLLSAQSLHSGDEHIQGQPDYVPEVSAILRDGVAFSWRN